MMPSVTIASYHLTFGFGVLCPCLMSPPTVSSPTNASLPGELPKESQAIVILQQREKLHSALLKFLCSPKLPTYPNLLQVIPANTMGICLFIYLTNLASTICKVLSQKM